MRLLTVIGRAVLLSGILGAVTQAHGFKLQPLNADAEPQKVNRLRAALESVQSFFTEYYIDHFSTPVHEDITHRIYGCNGGRAACESQLIDKGGAPRGVIEGVQWNDNPPFQLGDDVKGISAGCVGFPIQLPNLHPGCWGEVFAKASASASRGTLYGPKSLTLQRSHFGDMQFLHAMAPDDELPATTRDNILAWAEFTYRVSIGDIATDALVADPAKSPVAKFFPGRGWDVSTLFTLGTEPHTPERIRDMAFGSLLHVVEDSFSASHVQREDTRIQDDGKVLPGRVVEFHSYAHQDHGKHASSDALEALEQNANVTTLPTIVGRRLKAFREQEAAWDDRDNGVKLFLKAVFEIAPSARPAGPGDDYKPDAQQAGFEPRDAS